MAMQRDKEKGEAYLEMNFLSRRVASTMVPKVFPGRDNRCLEWLLDGPESPTRTEELETLREAGRALPVLRAKVGSNSWETRASQSSPRASHMQAAPQAENVL